MKEKNTFLFIKGMISYQLKHVRGHHKQEWRQMPGGLAACHTHHDNKQQRSKSKALVIKKKGSYLYQWYGV